MTAADFDTHKYAKRLQDAGEAAAVADIHAEHAGEVMREISSTNLRLEQVDSKGNADFIRLEGLIKMESAELKARIERSEANLVRWGAGLAVAVISASAAIQVALLKLFL